MSFLFDPVDYNDMTAINRPTFKEDYSKDITNGNVKIGMNISENIISLTKKNGKAVILIEGYPTTNFQNIINLITPHLTAEGYTYNLYNIEDIYKSEKDIEKILEPNLPPKSEEDPVALYGRIYDGTFNDFFVPEKHDNLYNTVKNAESGIHIIYGHGAASSSFQDLKDLIIYSDVPHAVACLRTKRGEYSNIGDKAARPFNEIVRRNYYVDYELETQLRRQLMEDDLIDKYICNSNEENLIMLERKAFNGILKELTNYPFRCKPIYVQGIWGGEFIRKVRNLPDAPSNYAWIFDFIPMEVTILVECNNILLEFPFTTFYQKYPVEIMGQKSKDTYGSYFPIRINYDDTFHSDGNMSVQVHPNTAFVKEHYNDLGAQDEAYYVIATGHNARTYVGFNEDADTDEFFKLTAQSEKDGSDVDYQKYISHIPSVPGRQIMLPSGTIHCSGQNQFILELGSLTVGSYTYKIYDYNRKDSEGNRRPIFSINGKKLTDTSRRTNWVKENIAFEPIELEKGEGYRELLVGRTDLMYYETRTVEIATNHKCTFKNNGQFTLLTLVDGENTKIYSKTNPEFCYNQSYLDVVVVPASIDEYVIENTGYQPVVVHKALLK